MSRELIDVRGVVQGVGFRPFVHRLATELGLDGCVGNDSTRVFIDVAGSPGAIEEFARRLEAEAPPLAGIETISRRPAADEPPAGFRIVASRDTDGARTLVAPDTAVCGDCVAELFDPADRRYRHPFITCTNCGPRFTIVESLPYDRPNTTMASFPLCGACEAEYGDPADRRYHAQPIACHECGPTLSFQHSRPAPAADTGAPPRDRFHGDPLGQTVEALAAGDIVAIKGLGGYHLACDATSDRAIAELRRRKHRPDKPLAVMVADLAAARSLASVDDGEADLLTSPAAPIVLVEARDDSPLSALVAPGNPLVGIMIAYTPVHHLLLVEFASGLVMTSANRSGQPIAYEPETLAALDDLYDAVLGHDRPIRVPCDDSVVRPLGDRLLPIRRARGYAPVPVPMAGAKREVLAVGGELKNTFCVVSDGHAWVSQHIGDMENLETLAAFETTTARFLDLYELEPVIVAADAHPGYLSSKWAHANYANYGTGATAEGPVVQEIQHHHAHIGAVMAEHQLDPAKPVLGFAFDGTGYGDDGTIWGGELLVADATAARRVAHLAPIPLPGGDAAIRNPGRVALAHLHAAGIEWSPDLAPVGRLSEIELNLLRRQLDRDVACVPTTSMGRLFDAVAALIGLRQTIGYEAQAAIELEILAATFARSGGQANSYRFVLEDEIVHPGPVFASIIADLRAGRSLGAIALGFHHAVAATVVELAHIHAAATGVTTVALSGGAFQNALLTQRCSDGLEAASFAVVTHALVPPNDGGLALGQAYIAAHRSSFDQPATSRQEP